MKIIVVKNRIDRKYSALIWTALILASLFNALYSLILEFGTYVGVKDIVINVILDVLYNGLLPAWLCYCCASIFSSMALRRGLRDISHSDFIYLTMIFTAAARFLMGLVKICALASEVVFVYASYICDVTILSAALYAMFFAVIYPKYLDPFSGRMCFKLWTTAYLVCQGIHTLLPCIANFVLKNDASFADRFQSTFANYGISFGGTLVTDDTVTASIVAVSIFAVLVVLTLVLQAVLDNKAKNYIPVIEAENNPFDDDGKVFDEFDI